MQTFIRTLEFHLQPVAYGYWNVILNINICIRVLVLLRKHPYERILRRFAIILTCERCIISFTSMCIYILLDIFNCVNVKADKHNFKHQFDNKY